MIRASVTLRIREIVGTHGKNTHQNCNQSYSVWPTSFLEHFAEIFHPLFLVGSWSPLEHASLANLPPTGEEDVEVFVRFIDQPDTHPVCTHGTAPKLEPLQQESEGKWPPT